MSKILNLVSNNILNKVNETEKKKMKNFPKARQRIVNSLIKKKYISETEIKIHGILITFFGCGKLPYGPGTFTSFITTLLWLGSSMAITKFTTITTGQEFSLWISLAIFLFFYGLLFIPLYSKKLESHDHSSIVIDEVVGQLLALCLTYPFIKEYYFDDSLSLNKLVIFTHIFSCFIFFRFLDIAKPLFIGWIDENIKNSFGVMFDDIVCGLMAAVINIAIFFVYQNTISQLHGTAF